MTRIIYHMISSTSSTGPFVLFFRCLPFVTNPPPNQNQIGNDHPIHSSSPGGWAEHFSVFGGPSPLASAYQVANWVGTTFLEVPSTCTYPWYVQWKVRIVKSVGPNNSRGRAKVTFWSIGFGGSQVGSSTRRSSPWSILRGHGLPQQNVIV